MILLQLILISAIFKFKKVKKNRLFVVHLSLKEWEKEKSLILKYKEKSNC
jgi:hypothetical protein